MAHNELHEHRGYLADERRMAAYRAALAEVVGPDDVVLDLGAGTGALGYLACEAGARAVIAVDRGDIVELARQIAADNGYGDRITHHRTLSTELALDRAVDVVVCDQIGGLVHDAGILGFFADARQRLLAPGGRFVPASFGIHLAPVTFDAGREAVEFWSSKPAALDVSAARALASNTEWAYHVKAEDLVALAGGAQLARFPSDDDGPISGSALFEATVAGRFDGFIGWFVAQMSPSVTLTNDPWSPERFDRWCNFYPVGEATEVEPGDRIGVQLHIRPRLGIVQWSTELSREGGAPRRFRHSTFHGSPLSRATLEATASAHPVPRSDRLELVGAVLGLVDGTRTRDGIVEALADRIGAGFASRAHLERFVGQVADLLRGEPS